MDLLNMIKFEFKAMCKTPIMILNFFGYPIILTLIIGYLTQRSFGGEISSYEFYSIGMMIFIFTSAGLTAVYNFIDKPLKDGNMRVMFSPVKTSSIYLSQIVSGTIFSTIAIIFTMLVFKFGFNVNYNGSELIIFLGFVALAFMSNSLGIFLCTVIDGIGTINLIYTFIQTVLCVLGGAFFSLEALGEIPAFLSKLSPVKWVMDGVLNSMYDENNLILYIIIVINVLIGGALIGVCKRTFKTEKYL